MRIGIISDTHGYLHPKFKEILSSCNYIIHAGDFSSEKIYRQFQDLAVPMYMVKGNNDHGSWAKYLPETLSFAIDGQLFFLIHDKSRLPYPFPEASFLIYGHTHVFDHSQIRGMTFLNPGSASESRTSLPPSIAILTLSNGQYEVERIFDRDITF